MKTVVITVVALTLAVGVYLGIGLKKAAEAHMAAVEQAVSLTQ